MTAQIDLHRCTQTDEQLLHQQRNYVDEFLMNSTQSSTAAAVAATTPSPSPVDGAAGRRSLSSDDDVSKASHSPSSSPRLSWEESFQNLSRNLQLICGSNGSIDEATSETAAGGAGGGDGSAANGTRVRIQQQPSPGAGLTGVSPRHRGNGGNILLSGKYRPISVASTATLASCLVGRHSVALHSGFQTRVPGGCVGQGGCPTSPVKPQQQGGSSFPYPPPSLTSTPNGRLPPTAGGPSMVPTKLGWRPIRVHHEETTDRLRQSLSKICLQPTGGSNNSSSTPSPSTSNASGLNQQEPSVADGKNVNESSPSLERGRTSANALKAHQLKVKESLKSGVRVRLDLDEVGCDPEFVVVSVRTAAVKEDGSVGDRVLNVWNATMPNVEPYVTVPLPLQTRVTALYCCVTDAKVLYVRERSKDVMHAEVEPVDAELFVPVIRDDEVQLTLLITLHVAEQFQFEDIAVRTIDDRLVMKGRRCSGGEVEAVLSSSFTVMISLPEGTYSRTVKAALAVKEHQLVVAAKRAPASRRMTCAF